jgi:hypothetical protein
LASCRGFRSCSTSAKTRWRDNRPKISCIPLGTYEVVPHGWNGEKVKFKNSWRLLNVPGRSGILLHEGNTHKDTEGCLLMGLDFIVGQLSAQVTDSRLTMRFLRHEIGSNRFNLEVRQY